MGDRADWFEQLTSDGSLDKPSAARTLAVTLLRTSVGLHQLPDGRVAVAGGVDQQGELLVGDLGEAAAAGQGDLGHSAVQPR